MRKWPPSEPPGMLRCGAGVPLEESPEREALGSWGETRPGPAFPGWRSVSHSSGGRRDLGHSKERARGVGVDACMGNILVLGESHPGQSLDQRWGKAGLGTCHFPFALPVACGWWERLLPAPSRTAAFLPCVSAQTRRKALGGTLMSPCHR